MAWGWRGQLSQTARVSLELEGRNSVLERVFTRETNWGLPGSLGSSFYHFGCLRDGRMPGEEAVGSFFFPMKL